MEPRVVLLTYSYMVMEFIIKEINLISLFSGEFACLNVGFVVLISFLFPLICLAQQT